MKIGGVQKKPVSFFKRNKTNQDFFEEEKLDLSSMIEDVKKRGVLVPLVAKEDGTLLAGHCRLKAAKAAGLKMLPVQIVTDMTNEEEFEYLIKDNAIRRHFTRDDRLKIYRRIYPEFDVVILQPRKISVQHIVDISGLNASTVNCDLVRIRHMMTDVRKKRPKGTNLIMLYKQLTTRVLNAVLAGQIKREDIKNAIDTLWRVLDDTIPTAAPKETTQRRLM